MRVVAAAVWARAAQRVWVLQAPIMCRPLRLKRQQYGLSIVRKTQIDRH
jgi:hypothetical protein